MHDLMYYIPQDKDECGAFEVDRYVNLSMRSYGDDAYALMGCSANAWGLSGLLDYRSK